MKEKSKKRARAVGIVVLVVVAIVGVVWAFTEIGIGWAKVQWLAAAMTVGLGFGLQEIFANFVSGLIILFERPVRVGDVVERGEYIADSGNTGYSSGPHLHFAVYRATEWGRTQSLAIRFETSEGVVDRIRSGRRYRAR